jgi:uncharacterized UPF0146 family protein
MQISYAHITTAWEGYADWLRTLIKEHRPKRVLEIGGGAKPAIAPGELGVLGIKEYTVVDISEEELAKAPPEYRKVCADICAEALPLEGDYDFVFSRMLAEHVQSPEIFHRNILSLLSPGGHAFHFFATMFSPIYMLNRLLPESVTERLLFFADPKRTKGGQHDKFPAHYRWCYGPVPWQIDRFRRLGYEIETYRGFFGHGYYNRVPGLKQLHEFLTSVLLRHPLPNFTTVAYLVLRRPTAS